MKGIGEKPIGVVCWGFGSLNTRDECMIFIHGKGGAVNVLEKPTKLSKHEAEKLNYRGLEFKGRGVRKEANWRSEVESLGGGESCIEAMGVDEGLQRV